MVLESIVSNPYKVTFVLITQLIQNAVAQSVFQALLAPDVPDLILRSEKASLLGSHEPNYANVAYVWSMLNFWQKR